ncbi:MAG TPA: hypothetical protein VNX87_10445 [Candidatus Sulfotelmatobacter sp.]|jgi:hypothetical protein|nr:hypothetical protein [Candidatus Sulfotelmatobacter sp.]
MIFADYAGTKEYRDELAGALDVARQRLNRRQFQIFAEGVIAEIARLDSQLAEFQDVLFPRAASNCWTPLFTKAIPSMGVQSVSIHFNSPVQVFAPWTSCQLTSDRGDNAFAACAI